MMRRISAALVALLLWVPAAFAMDCSSTVTSGTPKTIFNSSRTHGFFIVNLSADLVCLAFDAAASFNGAVCAQGSYPLIPGTATTPAGSFYTSAPGYIPTTASVASAGTGDAFSCTTW